jgi:hypothetical protein
VAPDTLPVVCVVPARLLPAAGSYSRGKTTLKAGAFFSFSSQLFDFFQVPNIWKEYVSCAT